MAVSYLTIAAGTGKSNRSSSWSAQAIETYTGLHSTRGKAAIKELIAAGRLCLEEKSSRARPRYTIVPYDGETVPAAEELIWLPNTLITGTVKREASPARRLRSRGDVDALRLLIDLYSVQHLSADGGVSRQIIWQRYKRERCGERDRHVVWGFTAQECYESEHVSTHSFRGWTRTTIGEALEVLTGMGLIEIVPHLVETSEPDCELVHGFGWNETGEQLEQQLAVAADEAARYIIGEGRLKIALRNGVQMFAPVWDAQPDVQMVGVFRLTYRPWTALTADWFRRMNQSAADWMEIYRRIGPPKLALQAAAGT